MLCSCGVSGACVVYWLWPGHSLPGLTMPSPQADDICSLHRQKPNLSQKEVASRLGVSVHAVRRALKQERARESEEQRPPAETRVENVACVEGAPRVDTTPWGYSSWRLTVPPVKAEEQKQSFGGQGYWTQVEEFESNCYNKAVKELELH